MEQYEPRADNIRTNHVVDAGEQPERGPGLLQGAESWPGIQLQREVPPQP